jgi:hypothetical protein
VRRSWLILPALAVLAAALAPVPARAGTTTITGFGFATTFVNGSEDILYLNLIGCQLGTCEPSAVALGDGAGAGGAQVNVYSTTPGHSFSVNVALVSLEVDHLAYPRLMRARGVGSDGLCYGISVLDSGPGDIDYIGIARAPLEALPDDSGPCVSQDRAYTEDDFLIEEI